MSEGRPAALITGGGSGIGLASAIALARAGHDVAVSGRRQNVLDDAVAAIEEAAEGATAIAMPCDVGDAQAAQQLVDDAAARLGRLDALVYSAGAYESTRFDELTLEDWDRIGNVLLRSSAAAAIAASKHMIPAGHGRIVLIGSVSGIVSEPDSAHYAAAKAGMSSLARSITVDLAKHGVIANTIASGFVDTPMTKGLTEHPDQDMVQGIYKKLNPLARAGRPEEIANLVRYLVVDAPEFLCGTTIAIDGGQTVMAGIH